MELRSYLRSRGALVNGYLQVRLGMGSISTVDQAMMYSVAAGGKRLRPILLMAAADAVGANGTDFVAVAAGLEMIHTYSLIHDDLPSMDNDDYRRGRLTNHKVFGDAMALLAGDGLLTQAFEVMLEQRGVDPQVLLDVVRLVAKCAGPTGMVGGQALDITSENQQLTLEQRFGDPETQVVLPLLEGDLLHIMEACTNGTLADEEVKFSDGAAACVILASGGYPVAYEKGKPISGLVDGQLPDEENVTVYHSGTALTEDGTLVTNGGRVLGVTATGPRLTNALSHAYEAAEKIHFDKLHKRSDIGLRALKALAEKQ